MILDFFVVVVGIGHCRFVCSCQDGWIICWEKEFIWVEYNFKPGYVVTGDGAQKYFEFLSSFFEMNVKSSLICYVPVFLGCRFKIVTAPPSPTNSPTINCYVYNHGSDFFQSGNVKCISKFTRLFLRSEWMWLFTLFSAFNQFV